MRVCLCVAVVLLLLLLLCYWKGKREAGLEAGGDCLWVWGVALAFFGAGKGEGEGGRLREKVAGCGGPVGYEGEYLGD